MSDLSEPEKKFRQYQALAESYNLGTLYSKVLDHMSKNASYNSEAFAEACKELKELYFDDFVVPVLDGLKKTFDEMPDIFKSNGATFYKDPEIDYNIIPTLFNVKPSAGKIDKTTSWKRGTPGLKEWKDTEEEKEKKSEKKITFLFQSLDLLEKSEDYKRADQDLAVLEKVKPKKDQYEELTVLMTKPTTTVEKQYEKLTDENRPIYNKHESVQSHFYIGAINIAMYKWLIENPPNEDRNEVKNICEKMIKMYDENFIEPCLGVYGCPASKREMGEPVDNRFGDTFDLHPSINLDGIDDLLNVRIEGIPGNYKVYLGTEDDELLELGAWIKGQVEKYEKDLSESIDYLKKNLVELALIKE